MFGKPTGTPNVMSIMKEPASPPKMPGLLKKKPKFGQVETNPQAAAPAGLLKRLTGK